MNKTYGFINHIKEKSSLIRTFSSAESDESIHGPGIISRLI